MRILLINNKSKTLNKLKTLLENFGDVDIIEFDSPLLHKSIERYDLLVLSGSTSRQARGDRVRN